MAQDAVHTAVVTMDFSGIVLDFSPAAERMLGYSREQAVGHRLSDLIIPARLRPAHEAGLRRYVETGDGALVDAAFRVPALRHDGTEIPVELVVSRTRHGGAEAFVGLLREVHRPGSRDLDEYLRAELFRALVEQSPHLVAVIDDAGHTRYASPSATALFAADDGGPRGLRFLTECAHPDDRGLAREAIRLATAGTPTEPVELRLPARDGSWRAVSLQARDLRAHPAVGGIAFFGTDATRARAAERRERIEYTRLLTLVESLKVGVLLQDEHRRVVLSNSAFVEMFEVGATPERLRGASGRLSLREYRDLFADPVSASARADEIVRRGRPHFGDEVALVDGRAVERDYVPITLDGSTLGHLWVFRDVTAQAEVRRTLQERNRILSELAALKTEFVAVLSHELRTPLTSIATFAGMLDAAAGLDPAEYRAAVGAIRRNADRMRSLVADLVLLARLESGEFALGTAPVALGPLILAATRASDAGHNGATPATARVSDGPPVTGDEDLLRQLLDTVFGVVGGIDAHMRIDAGIDAAAEGTRWVIRVMATATEPATTERLLATRLPHPRYPGEHRTGALALTLARAIAARHGGDLATSVGPDTVTVTVTLPAAC
jgi:PAS domain S-box-containing protein